MDRNRRKYWNKQVEEEGKALQSYKGEKHQQGIQGVLNSLLNFDKLLIERFLRNILPLQERIRNEDIQQ